MIRRFGQPRKTGVKYTRRPGAYALLPLGESLLLTHQGEPWPEFQLPGGGIDQGENPIEALHREIFEETGWSVSRPRRVGAFRRFTYMPEYDMWAEKICTIYVARPVRKIAPPTEPAHTAVWVPIAQAHQILGNAGDRHFAGLLARRAL